MGGCSLDTLQTQGQCGRHQQLHSLPQQAVLGSAHPLGAARSVLAPLPLPLCPPFPGLSQPKEEEEALAEAAERHQPSTRAKPVAAPRAGWAMAAENVLLTPAEMSPSLQGIPTAHSEVWKRARRLLGKLPGPLRSPAGSARRILPCNPGPLQVPRCHSHPAPYLQCTHPEGEDVHSGPVSLFCKTKPEPRQARGRGHQPLALGSAPAPCLSLCHRPLPSPPPDLPASAHASFLIPARIFLQFHSQTFPIYCPQIPVPKYSRWGSHREFSHGTKLPCSCFPALRNTLPSVPEPPAGLFRPTPGHAGILFPPNNC